MAPINYATLKKNLQVDNLNNFINFIETGTYHGNTIFGMEDHFEKLYTIEVKKQFYNECKNKYNGNKIKFYLGDSGDILGDICKEIEGKTIIWLDGHYGGGTHGKGKKNCPLVEELKHIINHLQYEVIIIIDDFRCFGTNIMPLKKKDLDKIVSKRLIKSYNFPSCHTKDDRLVYHISDNN